MAILTPTIGLWNPIPLRGAERQGLFDPFFVRSSSQVSRNDFEIMTIQWGVSWFAGARDVCCCVCYLVLVLPSGCG